MSFFLAAGDQAVGGGVLVGPEIELQSTDPRPKSPEAGSHRGDTADDGTASAGQTSSGVPADLQMEGAHAGPLEGTGVNPGSIPFYIILIPA